jgi:JmjC domain
MAASQCTDSTMLTQAPPSFADLLSPLTVSDFATRYWGREPLYLTGRPDRFAGIVDERTLSESLDTGRSRIGRLQPADPDLPLTAASTDIIDASQIEASLAEGYTVSITDLSAGSRFLRRMADSIANEIGTLGDARFNAFLSPPGSGAELHIDARVTTSLQIEGTKKWWFGNGPAIEWPRSNAQLLPDGTPVWMYPWCGGEPWEQIIGPDVDELKQVILMPGDLLCLPAGTWHAARAVDRSFALNLSFSPPDLPNLVRSMVYTAFVASPRWRGGLPLSVSKTHTDGPEDDLREALGSLLAEAGHMLTNEATRLATSGDSPQKSGPGRLGLTEKLWSSLIESRRHD